MIDISQGRFAFQTRRMMATHGAHVALLSAAEAERHRFDLASIPAISKRFVRCQPYGFRIPDRWLLLRPGCFFTKFPPSNVSGRGRDGTNPNCPALGQMPEPEQNAPNGDRCENRSALRTFLQRHEGSELSGPGPRSGGDQQAPHLLSIQN